MDEPTAEAAPDLPDNVVSITRRRPAPAAPKLRNTVSVGDADELVMYLDDGEEMIFADGTARIVKDYLTRVLQRRAAGARNVKLLAELPVLVAAVDGAWATWQATRRVEATAARALKAGKDGEWWQHLTDLQKGHVRRMLHAFEGTRLRSATEGWGAAFCRCAKCVPRR